MQTHKSHILFTKLHSLRNLSSDLSNFGIGVPTLRYTLGSILQAT